MINDICSAVFIMMIHLGKNPKNGGRPSKDKRLVKIANFVVTMILLEKVWLIWNILFIAKRVTAIIESKA